MLDLPIDEYIPHRDRMKLIDGVIEIDETRAVTAAVARESWPLADATGVNPIILIELIAQTAGIHNGWKKRDTVAMAGRGWIVGLREASFAIARIPLGANLVIDALNKPALGSFATIEGSVRLEEREIGRALLQAYQVE